MLTPKGSNISHMYPYRGWPARMLQVFGLSGGVEGRREEQPHSEGSATVSCCPFEAYGTS